MIQGLVVTVDAMELRDLCTKRAAHHDERAKAYREQAANMEAAKVEGMQYSGGDPIRALNDKRTEHENESAEMRFIAAHLEPTETYRLARAELHRLGLAAAHY